MKKVLLAILLIFCAYSIQATESTTQLNTTSQSQAKTYYEGPAWSAGEGLIPQAADSISIKWTSEGLWINGKSSGLSVFKISGGTFHIRVNGKSKFCTHYVNYGGEKFFFMM